MDKEVLLIDFPKTYAFVAFASAHIKGGKVSEWMEELKDYRIVYKHGYRRCYIFGLKSSNAHGNFDKAGVVACFGEAVIVLHEDEVGNLKEFEIPDDEVAVPFADEYASFEDENYRSSVTKDDAWQIAKQWFAEHQEIHIEQAILD